jgi:hypothetical protein
MALGGGLGSVSSSASRIHLDLDAFRRVPRLPRPYVVPGPRTWTGPDALVLLGLAVIGFGLLVVFVMWVASTLARGWLIAGAAAADSGEPTSFAQAWRAGWHRGGTLLGIAVLSVFAVLMIVLLGGLGVWAYAGGLPSRLDVPARGSLAMLALSLVCIAVPLAVVLEWLRSMANRACMLEGLGVLDSYRRAIAVLSTNLGPALILFLLQIVLSLVMAAVWFVPGAILSLCCPLWPVLLLVQGAVSAYTSTLWTLAWRRWTLPATEVGEALPA